MARSDAEGRFEMTVNSEQAYIVAVQDDERAAPYRDDVVVRAGQPVEGVDFVLGPATRLHGRVTVGEGSAPVPGASISVVIDAGQIPEELRREDDRYYRSVSMHLWDQADADGRFVSDLAQKDFLILEDGVRKDISYFSRERNQPVVVGFLLDLSNANRLHWTRFQEAAIELVLAMMPGDDERYSGYLISYGNDAEIQANTAQDPENILERLRKLKPGGGAAMYEQMRALGLRQVVIGVRFVPSDPMVIQGKAHLDDAVATAVAAGLRVVLAAYPYPPREIEAGLGSPTLFAGYVGALASIYPEVRQFVIGNEPNQPAFWRPQFDPTGANVSAKAFGPYLAAAYDALKGVDETLRVVGVGLSPRGNDRPDAKNNISTSPVRFLRALGEWYRRSGRTRPLMDTFSFHPYPRQATDPLDRGYSWPNVGFVNLDRLKQALWDAFRGTAQPTTVEGLKLHLDEVGWQVDTARRAGYIGRENVPVTDEITQAGIYAVGGSLDLEPPAPAEEPAANRCHWLWLQTKQCTLSCCDKLSGWFLCR